MSDPQWNALLPALLERIGFGSGATSRKPSRRFRAAVVWCACQSSSAIDLSTELIVHAVSPDSMRRNPNRAMSRVAHAITLMLDPRRAPCPYFGGMERPFRAIWSWATNGQSRSPRGFSTTRPASVTLGPSALPPASSNNTLTRDFRQAARNY